MDISNISKKSDYNKNKGDNNIEYNDIKISFDFKEKNIDDEEKIIYQIFIQKFTFLNISFLLIME